MKIKKFFIIFLFVFLIATIKINCNENDIDKIFEYLLQKYKEDKTTIDNLIIIAEYILKLRDTILLLQEKNENLIKMLEEDKKIIKDLTEQIDIYKNQLEKNNKILQEIKNYINKNYFFNYAFFVTTVFNFEKIYLNFIFFNYFTILGFGINYNFINKQFDPLFTIGIRINF